MSAGAASALSAGSVLGAGQAAGGILGAYNSISSSRLQAKQYKFEGQMAKAQADWNSTLLTMQSDELMARSQALQETASTNFKIGNQERQRFVSAKRQLDKRTQSRQRAMLGKAGVVVDTGTASDLQMETAVLQELEIMNEYRKQGAINTDQYNATMSQVQDLVYGSGEKAMQAIQAKAGGDMALIGGSANASLAKAGGIMNAAGTLLGSTTQAYSSYKRYG